MRIPKILSPTTKRETPVSETIHSGSKADAPRGACIWVEQRILSQGLSGKWGERESGVTNFSYV